MKPHYIRTCKFEENDNENVHLNFGTEKHTHSARRRRRHCRRPESEMKKIFGTKKSKEPTPTIQDATNQVRPPPLSIS
jgi:hypothetical protein